GRPRVRWRGDRGGVVVALLCAAVAGALTVPGFSYGVADKDPGGYVTHAVEISRSGDYAFVDPLLSSGAPVQLTSPGARFPGIWIRGARDADGSCGADRNGCTIVPQFYHLWPALLAVSYDVAGFGGLFATVPLMGVLSVLLLVAVLRRVGDALLPATRPSAGLVAGLAGGLLLATNMLQVWQTRFPTTEVLAQALFLGALLGVVVTLQTGWRPAAGFAGLMVGVGWLNRSDGFLLVLLAVAVGAVLLTVRRWDPRASWFAAGLGVVVPHALVQGYHLARPYTDANPHVSLGQWALLVGGCLGLALVLRTFLRAPLAAAVAGLERRRVQVGLGLLVVLGAAGLLALGFLRARLFGADLFDYNGREIRSFDEQIMPRLTWFLGLPAFALMLGGLLVVAVRRWSASVWAVVIPTLLLFPVYGYTASNSTRLMWWTRRYIPTVLPGILVLVALAIAFAVVWRYRGRAWLRVPAGLALAGLVAFFLSQSLPLRSHDEWGGSLDITERVAGLAGAEQGLYLWEPLGSPGQACCASTTQLFATSVWLVHGQVSGLLPTDPGQRAALVADYRARFPTMAIFVLADRGEVPQGLDPAALTPVDHIVTTLPMWEESNDERPDEAREIPVDLSIWRVTGT
ncbi:MAG: hypothetical protein JWN57_1388, partial [Frankiales bacterium]|nr:hypothetical protein [Frankiales bacterium]